MKYVANYAERSKSRYSTATLYYHLQLNSAGFYERDEAGGPVHRPSGRDDWYLSYHHDGKMRVKTSQGYQVIGPGSVFIFRPDEEQYYGQADDQPYQNYWVHFTGFGAGEIMAIAGLTDKHIFHVGQNDQLVQLFESLISELMYKKKKYNLITASILIQIIGLIGRINNRKDSINESAHHSVRHALNEIHQQAPKPVRISHLADVCHMSTSRFSAVFKEEIGVSPQQYIVNFRLSKACELLRYSELTIRQISNLCGFSDQLYFSRMFRKHVKQSPSHWRQENQSASISKLSGGMS